MDPITGCFSLGTTLISGAKHVPWAACSGQRVLQRVLWGGRRGALGGVGLPPSARCFTAHLSLIILIGIFFRTFLPFLQPHHVNSVARRPWRQWCRVTLATLNPTPSQRCASSHGLLGLSRNCLHCCVLLKLLCFALLVCLYVHFFGFVEDYVVLCYFEVFKQPEMTYCGAPVGGGGGQVLWGSAKVVFNGIGLIVLGWFTFESRLCQTITLKQIARNMVFVVLFFCSFAFGLSCAFHSICIGIFLSLGSGGLPLPPFLAPLRAELELKLIHKQYLPLEAATHNLAATATRLRCEASLPSWAPGNLAGLLWCMYCSAFLLFELDHKNQNPWDLPTSCWRLKSSCPFPLLFFLPPL